MSRCNYISPLQNMAITRGIRRGFKFLPFSPCSLILQRYGDLFKFLMKLQRLLTLTVIIELILLNESCMGMPRQVVFLKYAFLARKSFPR